MSVVQEVVRPEEAGATAGDHRRRLAALAWPVYVELLAGVVAGIIDVFWVSHLGSPQTAAVAVATNLENLLLGVILIAEVGMTVVVSSRLGAGDVAGARGGGLGGWALFAVITPLVVVGGVAGRGLIVDLFFTPGAAEARHAADAY